MYGRVAHINIGNRDSWVFQAWKENDPKGHLVCLGKDNFIRIFFVDLDLVNNKTPDPVKMNTPNFHLALDGFLNAFDGDFLY